MNVGQGVAVAKDLANIQLGNAVADALKVAHHAKKSSLKTLRQTDAMTRKFKKFPTKGKSTVRFKGFKDTKYRRMYGRNSRKALIGLNSGHKHKFRQHITGKIFPMGQVKCLINRPLKAYQRAELKYYPHPIQQKILLYGQQAILAGSDNILSDKVDYEDFVTTNDKNLIACTYYPITGCANFSGIHSFTRMDVDADSEGFSKVQCIGRQNRCDLRGQLDMTSDATIATSIAQHVARPDCILTGCFLKLQAQANRNYACKITVTCCRMSLPADVVTNQGLTNSELVECTNNMTHIDYDTAEILFQQSKILPPCRSEKFVTQHFDIGFNGYYKLTQEFKDETTNTLASSQGVAFKYGQQAKAKIAGSFLSQNNLSNRLAVFIKVKRLGDSQIGMATQSKEFVEVGITKRIGVQQPYNQEDGDVFAPNVTGHNGVLPTDNYIGDNLVSASFRCKAELTLNYRVKDGVRNIPIYITNDSKNGKTRILHASTFDSNYGTLNSTLNVTD
tara:strand:+ start:393 stop:1904 length:1512 start_codon:yes stop_codon:yes gene_type:complete